MSLRNALPVAALGLGLSVSEGCHHPVEPAPAFTAEVMEENVDSGSMARMGLNYFKDQVRAYALDGTIDCPQTMGGDYPSWVSAEEERCAWAMADSITFEQVETLWANAVAANDYCEQDTFEDFDSHLFRGPGFEDKETVDCLSQIIVDFYAAIDRVAADLSTVDSGYEPCWVFDLGGNYFAYEQDPNHMDDPSKSANGGCYAE